MAGKEGAAATLMGTMSLKLAHLLAQTADTLIAQPPPQDGAGVEKLARHVKALADAGRIVVALEQAADKARAAAPAAASDPGSDFGPDFGGQADEMDMDDDDFAALDPDVVARRCADFDARVGRLVGQLECKGLPGRARTLREAGLRRVAAVRAACGADPA